MKTLFVIFYSTFFSACVTTQHKPKLPRQPKSFIYLPDKKGFCRIEKNSVSCVKNDGLIAYSFEDNTMILNYILNLNKSCK